MNGKDLSWSTINCVHLYQVIIRIIVTLLISAPSDYQNNSNIVDICKKITIGKQLLRKWNISF